MCMNDGLRVWERLFAPGARPHLGMIYRGDDLNKAIHRQFREKLVEYGFGWIVLHGVMYDGEPPERPDPDSKYGYHFKEPSLVAHAIRALHASGIRVAMYVHGAEWCRHQLVWERLCQMLWYHNCDGLYLDGPHLGSVVQTVHILRMLRGFGYTIIVHASVDANGNRQWSHRIPEIAELEDYTLRGEVNAPLGAPAKDSMWLCASALGYGSIGMYAPPKDAGGDWFRDKPHFWKGFLPYLGMIDRTPLPYGFDSFHEHYYPDYIICRDRYRDLGPESFVQYIRDTMKEMYGTTPGGEDVAGGDAVEGK